MRFTDYIISIFYTFYILALDMNMQEAIDLSIKILTKTMDSPTLDADQLEVCTLKLEKDKPKYHQFDSKELDERIKKYQETHKDEEET